jgi:hypothetical protein
MIKLKSLLKEALLKEAYGVNKLAADLEAWAKKEGVNFKKVSSEKKPGNYGSTVTNTFYQIGDKFCLVRTETVTGAPRLNQLIFHITDKPDMTAKSLGGSNYVSDFSDITSILKKANIVGGKEVTHWDKNKIEKFVKDLGRDKKYNKFNDDQAFEMAQSILDDNEGLEKGIKTNYRVTDAAGWLADKM